MSNITSLDELKNMSQEKVVTLPPFSDGRTLTVKIKNPSLLKMIGNGTVPNQLLDAAMTLFNTGNIAKVKDGATDPADVQNNMTFLIFLAEQCLVEPTMADLKEAGVELTDEQIIFLFIFTRGDATALEAFRKDGTNTASGRNGTKIPKAAK